jgi:hypothetical protein
MMEKPPPKRALEAGPAPTAPIAPWRISKKVQTAIGFMANGDCKKIREAAEKCWACPRKPEPRPRHPARGRASAATDRSPTWNCRGQGRA